MLEVRAAPGTRVRAELALDTPIGRRFLFRAGTLADAGGLARLRVPYATEPGPPTRARGPWRVWIGGAETGALFSERDVLEGGVVRVGAPGAAEPAAEPVRDASPHAP